MKWEKIRRASGLIEWACEHGCGHPDANSVEELSERRAGSDDPPATHWSVHGCDGCCSRADFPGRRKTVISKKKE
jgi:hypothetical protein